MSDRDTVNLENMALARKLVDVLVPRLMLPVHRREATDRLYEVLNGRHVEREPARRNGGGERTR